MPAHHMNHAKSLPGKDGIRSIYQSRVIKQVGEEATGKEEAMDW